MMGEVIIAFFEVLQNGIKNSKLSFLIIKNRMKHGKKYLRSLFVYQVQKCGALSESN